MHAIAAYILIWDEIDVYFYGALLKRNTLLRGSARDQYVCSTSFNVIYTHIIAVNKTTYSIGYVILSWLVMNNARWKGCLY